jgi:uncharacterized protein
LKKTGRTLPKLMGDAAFLATLRATEFADERFGVPTVKDILAELARPGRDPRPSFETARFKEGVEALTDLKPGMELEGTVTNVTQFGAFVDIGVHQDGLVHISQLADRFVGDPREVVKAGQTVKVRVVEVDLERKRVALTMKTSGGGKADAGKEAAKPGGSPRGQGPPHKGPQQPQQQQQRAQPSGVMAEALKNAVRR